MPDGTPKKKRTKFDEDLVGSVFIWVVAFVLIVGFVALISLGETFWRWLDSHFEQQWAAIIACALILMAGYALFRVRSRWCTTYGVIEITFALASAWRWFSSVESFPPTDRETQQSIDLLAAAAIVYIIVRGFDNCSQGLAERRKKKEDAKKIPGHIADRTADDAKFTEAEQAKPGSVY